MNRPFERVLIANRGEIAVRIARTLKRLGIHGIVVLTRDELDSPAARAASQVVELVGSDAVSAYLDADQIIAKAQAVGAQAIHPGYGFLAENADFAASVADAHLIFVGPSPATIRLMGDKIKANAFVKQHGYAVLASEAEEDDPESFLTRAGELGFPLVVKPSAGGGGKGIQAVANQGDLEAALASARRDAQRYFGDGRLYVERCIERPRHIEVQILADRQGNCLHLFERECSIQRRFQKLIEECPAPGLPHQTRAALYREAVGIASAANYEGAGTVEFLLAPDGSFSFLEMNTRLQVEHPVTELVTGIDLVEQQLRIAAGQALAFSQKDVQANGHAMECRLCAEVPEENFMASTGVLRHVHFVEHPDVRYDAGIQVGSQVTSVFDSLLAKIAVLGADRTECLHRLQAALKETALLGLRTNTRYLAGVIGHAAFQCGDLHTGFLSEHADALCEVPAARTIRAAVFAAALTDASFLEAIAAVPDLHRSIGLWRN